VLQFLLSVGSRASIEFAQSGALPSTYQYPMLVQNKNLEVAPVTYYIYSVSRA
jgi:hypothetical protein